MPLEVLEIRRIVGIEVIAENYIGMVLGIMKN